MLSTLRSRGPAASLLGYLAADELHCVNDAEGLVHLGVIQKAWPCRAAGPGAAVTAPTSADPAAVRRSAASTDNQKRCGAGTRHPRAEMSDIAGSSVRFNG
jgi:hypothetical protein